MAFQVGRTSSCLCATVDEESADGKVFVYPEPHLLNISRTNLTSIIVNTPQLLLSNKEQDVQSRPVLLGNTMTA